jgi:hypothetical protein
MPRHRTGPSGTARLLRAQRVYRDSESGFGPTADRQRAITWNSTSASETDMWLTLIAITLVVAMGFCALAFVVQFEP